jgi:acetyl esterase/lipase
VITHSLAVRSDSIVVVPNYRRVPEVSLLLALEDSLSVYESLLDLVESKQIALCGDSAGGTLCVLALSRIRDRKLAMPSCGLLLSPWCNFREVPTVPSPVDYLTQDVIAFMIELIQGEGGLTEEQLSSTDPMSVNLTGLPPLCVQLGDAELFVDQIRAFVKRCRVSDVDVVLHEYHEMVHIPHFFSFLSSEGKRAMVDAAAFIKNNVSPLF